MAMLVDGWPSAGVGLVVVLGAQLDPGDVADVDDRAGGAARDDEIGALRRS